jgi:hypothetical protein
MLVVRAVAVAGVVALELGLLIKVSLVLLARRVLAAAQAVVAVEQDRQVHRVHQTAVMAATASR